MTETTPEVTTYRVPSWNVEGLKKKMATLAKRAAKLGCEVPSLMCHGFEDVQVMKAELDPVDGLVREKPTGRVDRFYLFEVKGSAPKFAGWSLVAGIDVMPEAGNMVRVAPGATLPEKYRTEAPHCDHCGHKRSRVNHYVVTNGTSYKMVGSSCLRDFLGHQSPENVLAMASFWSSLDGVMREACGGSGTGTPEYLDLVEFLSYVAAAIRRFGWVSAAKARESTDAHPLTSTKQEAISGMFHRLKECKDGCLHYTVEDKCLAHTAVEWAKTLEVRSDFDHNVKTLATCEVMPYKGAGVAAAIIFCYKRSVEQEILREKGRATMANSRHVGAVGERGVFKVTVLSDKTIDGQFGLTTIYKMITVDGNVLTWFSSTGGLEVGKEYALKGTVKAHDTYNGVQQTVVTRCKVVKKAA